MEKKGLVIFLFALFLFLSACNNSDKAKYVYWTVETENQIERLERAEVDYKIQNREIWVKENDVKKAVQCCT
ncbi:hypothetical protein [Paenibacillus sp. Soil522]|uniref:hypothetical protein n=1 Tax=Paenibacillus sp. Soil522 TaxID=1736388 RepID=UPI000B0A0996|nr:hypothetical protein [Paenibacillus sp. Soil522]